MRLSGAVRRTFGAVAVLLGLTGCWTSEDDRAAAGSGPDPRAPRVGPAGPAAIGRRGG